MTVSLNDLLKGPNTTVLADLGPLPDVVETTSHAVWELFLRLQAQQPGAFPLTEPSSLGAELVPAAQSVTVQHVMLEARRLNRVCPRDRQWQQLCAVLAKAAGSEPPAPILPPESLGTPPLVKRIRFRDQVEWCEQRGQLRVIYEFVKSLAEEDWMHIRG
jgi:hypothetical protein